MTAAEYRELIKPFAEAYARTLLDRGIHHTKVMSTVKAQSTIGIRQAVAGMISTHANNERREREIYQ